MPLPAPRLPVQRLTAALFAGLLLASGCATPRSPAQVGELLESTLKAAWLRQQADMAPEAAVLAHAVAMVDSEYPGLAELREMLDPEEIKRMKAGWLGINRRLRPAAERSLGTRVLLWLPDRLLDVLDVASVDVHFGPGVFADSHVTRGFQAAAGFRSTGGLGLHENRSLGFKSRSEVGATLIAAGAHSYAGANMGTTGVLAGSGNTLGLHRPGNPLYHQLLDYWAVGASATVVFLGADLDVHPIQLVDLFAGFVGIDFLNDDLARTRRVDLDAVERGLVREVWEVRRQRRTVEAYLAARTLLAPPEAPALHDDAPEPQDDWRATDPPLPAAPAQPE